MTTKIFSEFYFLPEMEVRAMRNTSSGVSFLLNMDFRMKFEGGNHVRTEFDMTLFHEFLFKGVKIPHDFDDSVSVTEQSYHDGMMFLVADGEKLAIPETEVIVHPNVMPFVDHTIG